ncbi:MAG TPA: hypothetical protein DCL44_08715 [Elusimicrobia bacterium]|nr:hypothetical protein [Elusimicrobiota bacterium]
MENKKKNATSDYRVEGFGDGLRNLHTPEIMRDCIRGRYWESPARVELFITAVRLADDFKRRGFSQQKTLEIIQERLTAKFNLVKPESLKQIETALNWVYKKQDHPLTCSGALWNEGLCHKATTRCRFNEIDSENRQFVKKLNPIIPPAAVDKYLEGLHPTEALFARWTYLEFLRLEQEHNLLPGNPKEPIYIGFRAIAARVAMRNKTLSYDRHTACNSVRLLEDNGFIKTVFKGTPGTMRRKANGYIRLTPISLKYNSESQIGAHICVQGSKTAKNEA